MSMPCKARARNRTPDIHHFISQSSLPCYNYKSLEWAQNLGKPAKSCRFRARSRPFAYCEDLQPVYIQAPVILPRRCPLCQRPSVKVTRLPYPIKCVSEKTARVIKQPLSFRTCSCRGEYLRRFRRLWSRRSPRFCRYCRHCGRGE